MALVRAVALLICINAVASGIVSRWHWATWTWYPLFLGLTVVLFEWQNIQRLLVGRHHALFDTSPQSYLPLEEDCS